MTKQPSQAALARELGISGPAVSKLKAQGMPTHSADAARAWRRKHLNIAKMKSDPGPSPETLVARAQDVMAIASQALAVGRIDLVAVELRASLRAVPVSHRGDMLLDAAVMEHLTRDFINLIRPEIVEPCPLPLEWTDEEAEAMGSFWYSLAAGERVAVPLA